MAKTRRKTLPADFAELVRGGDPAAIIAVFDQCQIEATGGYTKGTALFEVGLPDLVRRWLVDQGADINARDRYQCTPLHRHAGHWQGSVEWLLDLGADAEARDVHGNRPLHFAANVGNGDAVRRLIEAGADPEARNDMGYTPLRSALEQCSNAMIVRICDVAQALMAAVPPRPRGLIDKLFGRGDSGVLGDPALASAVTRIGEQFEFHRPNFAEEHRDAASAALDRLYQLFAVPPVPRRVMHDGKAAIAAGAGDWLEQHAALWAQLVPSSGPAQSVQGEVIRIGGKIHHEINGNGGGNWDRQFGKMIKAWLGHVASGHALDQADLRELAAIAKALPASDATGRICELGVRWVSRNPDPVPLPPVGYDR